MKMHRLLKYVCLILMLGASGLAQCGGPERWGVKDGTDTDSRPVDLNDIKSISISDLVGIQEPGLPPRTDNETRLPQETHVYKVKARLVKWKEEAGETGDNDYPLVLTDDTLRFTQGRGKPTGHSFIGEIPDPDCLPGANGTFGNTSPFLPTNPNAPLYIAGFSAACSTRLQPSQDAEEVLLPMGHDPIAIERRVRPDVSGIEFQSASGTAAFASSSHCDRIAFA